MTTEPGRVLTDQALVASDQARSGLDPAGFDPSRMLFSRRMRVRDAIAKPESVLPRGAGEGWQEDYAHWQTRAALSVLSAIAMEARQGRDGETRLDGEAATARASSEASPNE